MTTDPSQVIVTSAECSVPSFSTTHVHHRHFPEIQAEGVSALVAAGDLIRRMASALEDTPNHWHRRSLRQAIADVEAFVDRSRPPS